MPPATRTAGSVPRFITSTYLSKRALSITVLYLNGISKQYGKRVMDQQLNGRVVWVESQCKVVPAYYTQ